MLAEETVSASSAITLAQATPKPDAVSVELSPGKARLVHPDSSGCLLHTNHFLRRHRADQTRQWSPPAAANGLRN